MRSISKRGALAALVALAMTRAPAAAQAPEASAEDEGAEAEAAPDVPEPPNELEARLAAIEARERARDAELERALGRVDELERTLAASAEAEPAPAAPAAPSGPTVRPLASFLTRFEHRDGYAALGAANPGCFPGANDGDCLRYRAEVGLAIEDLRVADEIVAAVRFRPQVAGFWSFGGTSGGVAHPALGLFEGALILQLGDMVRIDAGRIVLNYGDEMVLGSLRWHPAGRSFDGARMRIQPETSGYWIDVFWTMLDEGGPGGFGWGDGYLYGAYAGLGPILGPNAALDVYALARQDNDRADPRTGAMIDYSLRLHVGSRFRYRVDVIDLRAEAGFQTGRAGGPAGTDPALILAGHVDAEVGVNLLEDRLRFGAHGFYASGENPSSANTTEAYDQLFPTAHAFLGWSDVMGPRRNVTGGALHVMGKPVPQLRVSLDLFVFARPEDGGRDAYVGSEGNLQASWLPGAGLRVRGMYALFVPNAGAFAMGRDPVHYVEVEVGYELN
ncbi:MAG: alginate export family protein [Sandaracinaceae bacterium]|nr:alginate export family protein [Sandaracinaceae bacterium]